MESHRTDVSKEENIEYLPDLFEYRERKFLSATGKAEGKFRIYRLKSRTKDKKVRCSEITENYHFLIYTLLLSLTREKQIKKCKISVRIIQMNLGMNERRLDSTTKCPRTLSLE